MPSGTSRSIQVLIPMPRGKLATRIVPAISAGEECFSAQVPFGFLSSKARRMGPVSSGAHTAADRISSIGNQS